MKFYLTKKEVKVFMKITFKIIFITISFIITIKQVSAAGPAVDSTGYPGDNFSLHGALEMFQKSKSPEEFEKLINTKEKNVNNLDLNKDGKIDYVRVVDRSEKKSHVFILQVPVSQKENQDIALITLEKTGDTSAVIQIVGDKDIYGKEIVLEPGNSQKDLAGAYENNLSTRGPSVDFTIITDYLIVVNVWYWPCVSYVYSPVYTSWVSPWYWGYYPTWWVSWRPVSWYTWYPACAVYHNNYVVAGNYRVTGYYNIYSPYRSSAVSVTKQTAAVAGPNGAAVGTKTTVTGPNGRSATRVSGAAVGPNGAVRGTSVRRGRW